MLTAYDGDVIIALDFEDSDQTLAFLSKFQNEKPFVKIGMELFYKEGPNIVKEVASRGHKIFLDLKLHDIPNTVNKAMKSLSTLPIDMIDVHAGGSIAMMEAASHAFDDSDNRPAILAITALTSLSKETLNKELMIEGGVEGIVSHYAENAAKAGLEGVVCSPWEAQMVHDACGDSFITVTPGIRFIGDDTQDQARIASPEKAMTLGSDFIVMGRPITQAQDPVEAYNRARREFLGKDA